MYHRDTPVHRCIVPAVILLIMTQMDNTEIPVNIFLDLSKAFNSIDRKILLAEFEYYGIKGVVLGLLRNYLTDRKQYVEIGDVKSNMLNISTGVPHGSILGPLLFIRYINDFAESSKMFSFIMYADDTTLSSTLDSFSTHEENGDVEFSINIELHKISEWLKVKNYLLT